MIETALPPPPPTTFKLPLDPGTVDAENPWPGLSAFREADHQFFFGREREAEALRRAVLGERLTILFGRSGLGKTSLLQAGLFPHLREESLLPILIRLDFGEGVERGGSAALVRQVRAAIARAAGAVEVETPPLDRDATLWETFHRVGADFWSLENRPVFPVLVFDQFEEIFTLGRSRPALAEACDQFLTELADLIEGRAPATVKARLEASPEEARAYDFQRHGYKTLLSLREDFLPDLESLHDRIPSLGHNRFRLRRMNGEEALLVVMGAGGEFVEEPVARRIVSFVAGEETASGVSEVPLPEIEVEPALLSVVCRELNNMRRQQGEARITADLLAGHRTEILSDFYERSLTDLGPEVRIFIEDRLLTATGYRDTVALENALREPGITQTVLDGLIDRRLLRKETRGEQQRIELTHDVLTSVIRDSRDTRRQREAQQANEAARLAAEERERQARHALRRSRWVNLILGLLLLTTVFGVVFAYQQKTKADSAARKAEDAQLQAENLILYMLGDLRDELIPIGQLKIIKNIHGKISDYFSKLPESGESPKSARLRRQAYAESAQVYLNLGDIPESRRQYLKALAIAKNLAKKQPGDNVLQDELATSYEQVGSALHLQSEDEEAQNYLLRSLAIRQELVKKEPDNYDLAYRLMDIHATIGATYTDVNPGKALTYYQEGWDIGEKLAAKYSGRQDLESAGCSIAQQKILLLLAYGSPSKDLESFATTILKKRKELADGSTEPQPHIYLSNAHQVLALIEALNRENNDAIAHSSEALKIIQEVAKGNPDNALVQYDLALSHGFLGEVYWNTGQATRSGDHFQEALRIAHKLWNQDQSNQTWKTLLAGACVATGRSFLARSDYRKALQASQAAMELFQSVANPNQLTTLNSLSMAHIIAGQAYAATGQETRAREEWEKALKLAAPITAKIHNNEIMDTQVRALILLGRVGEARPLASELLRRGWAYSEFREVLSRAGLLPQGQR